MTGYVPNHHPSCQTRTYPTKCPYCGMRVFFFSCSCQSAVFFESLGSPWPIHECPARRYKDLREHGLSADSASLTVHTEAIRRGGAILGQVAENMKTDAKVEAARRAGPKKTIYRDVLPEEARDFVGTVMSLDRKIGLARIDQCMISWMDDETGPGSGLDALPGLHGEMLFVDGDGSAFRLVSETLH